ncbi:hypothetical protein [Clostridium sp. 'White wine YQ']|uniref:hypothetical protein n=1 Tax=Clostridium sp. 'White wine YQ' TaxID=3027474 RepID=UPI00236611CA|nr:hypothetical protein [Clostridium sp. 'White wine YQ']MDD7793715.1 hypothetical protein [Clostridium sp. 'White wine YQ']
MILRYLFIKEYDDLMEDLELNFGSKYVVKLDKFELTIKYNNNYIENFYGISSSVKDVTGIIGKNASGKTSILKAINSIFANARTDLEYIIIVENNDKLEIFKNLDSKVRIRSDLSFTIKRNMNLRAYNTKLIYYSSIFDKSKSLLSNNNLIDSSTNNLLRDYINNEYKNLFNIFNLNKDKIEKDLNNLASKKYVDDETYKNDIETLIKKNNQRIDKIYALNYEDIELIDEFKKSEIIKKIQWFHNYKEKIKGTKFDLLFKFPNNLKLSFADDTVKKTEILEYMGKKESLLQEEYFLFDDLNMLYWDSLDLEGYEDEIKKEEKLKNQFLLLMLFEVFYKVTTTFEVDINDVIETCLNELNSAELKNIEEISLNAINKIIKRNIEIEEPGNEIIIKDFDDELYKKGIINDIYLLFENIKEHIDEYDLTQDSIKFYEDLNEFNLNFSRILEDISNNHEIMDKIDFNILKEVNNLEMNDYYNLNTIRLGEFEEYDIDDDFIEKVNETIVELEKVFMILVDTINKQVLVIENNKAIERKVITGEFIESNEQIVSYINIAKKAIHSFLKIINNDIENNEDLNLVIKWHDINLLNFIKNINELNIETFYIVYDHEDLSSGHRAYLDMYSRLDYVIENEIGLDTKNIIFLIDEGDVYLHPEIQIGFLKNFIDFLNLFYNNINIQLIVTSNSPFIISDIPNTNLIYLDIVDGKIKNITDYVTDMKTFGANIHNLLMNSFFMKKGTSGEFAKERIDKIIKRILNIESIKEDEKEYIYKNINIIGEPLIRLKLLNQWERHFGKNSLSIEKEIEFHRNELKRLEELNMKGKINND